jgi:hypothetical protein
VSPNDSAPAGLTLQPHFTLLELATPAPFRPIEERRLARDSSAKWSMTWNKRAPISPPTINQGIASAN